MSLINPHIKSRLNKQELRIKPLDYYVDGITKKQDYYVLSESITLLESEQEEHRKLALDILISCYGQRSPSFRFGITGSPGVGKSTFIDSIVEEFTKSNNKVGVLTIDPSSTDGKGSILGDKTRMNALVKNNDIFIRPSPSNRHLGGLNQFTYEAIILCEAAGMNRIFIETVGVGQSEVDVSRHTDATILLVLPGGGDSLQGIKKGVLEKADLVVVNKSDGDSNNMAKASAREFKEALHLNRYNPNIAVINYSSLTKFNQSKLFQEIESLMKVKELEMAGARANQAQEWLHKSLRSLAERAIDEKIAEKRIREVIERQLREDSPFSALSFFKNHMSIDLSIKK